MAAAACVLAALVFGLEPRQPLGQRGGLGGGASASAERAAAPLGVGAGGASRGAARRGPLPAPKGSTERPSPPARILAAAQAQRLLELRAVISRGPAARCAPPCSAGCALNSPLPKALGSFDLQRGHGSH